MMPTTTIAKMILTAWSKDKEVEFQVQLRAPIPPIRGKLTCSNADEGAHGREIAIFEMEMLAQDGPLALILPITFAADDVLWYSTGPKKSDQPSIITPGAGGLSVGGRPSA